MTDGQETVEETRSAEDILEDIRFELETVNQNLKRIITLLGLIGGVLTAVIIVMVILQP